ncbi:hypothetical protein ACXWRW_12245, partial [Streptococcus pyogenes]
GAVKTAMTASDFAPFCFSSFFSLSPPLFLFPSPSSFSSFPFFLSSFPSLSLPFSLFPLSFFFLFPFSPSFSFSFS